MTQKRLYLLLQVCVILSICFGHDSTISKNQLRKRVSELNEERNSLILKEDYSQTELERDGAHKNHFQSSINSFDQDPLSSPASLIVVDDEDTIVDINYVESKEDAAVEDNKKRINSELQVFNRHLNENSESPMPPFVDIKFPPAFTSIFNCVNSTRILVDMCKQGEKYYECDVPDIFEGLLKTTLLIYFKDSTKFQTATFEYLEFAFTPAHFKFINLGSWWSQIDDSPNVKFNFLYFVVPTKFNTKKNIAEHTIVLLADSFGFKKDSTFYGAATLFKGSLSDQSNLKFQIILPIQNPIEYSKAGNASFFVDYSKAELLVQGAMPLSFHDSTSVVLSINEISIQKLHDQTPEMSLSGTTTIYFPQHNLHVEYNVDGNWNSSASTIMLSGGYKKYLSNENKPFDVDWISLEGSALGLKFDLKPQLRLQSTTFAGKVKIWPNRLHSPVSVALHGNVNIDTKEFFFKLNVKKNDISEFISNALVDKKDSLPNGIIYQSNIEIVIANCLKATAYKEVKLSSGIHAFGQVKIKEESDAAKVLTHYTFSMDSQLNFQLSVPFKGVIHLDDSEILSFKIFAPLITWSPYLTFQNITISYEKYLDTKDSKTAANGQLLWTPLSNDTDNLLVIPKVNLTISTSWTSNTQSLLFVGNLISEGESPFHIFGMSEVTADLKMSIQGKEVESFVLEGKGIFHNEKDQCNIKVSASDNAKDYIINVQATMKLNQMMRSIAIQDGTIQQINENFVSNYDKNFNTLQLDTTLIATNKKNLTFHNVVVRAGITLFANVSLQTDGEYIKSLQPIFQPSVESKKIITTTVAVYITKTNVDFTLRMDDTISITPALNMKQLEVNFLVQGNQIKCNCSGTLMWSPPEEGSSEITNDPKKPVTFQVYGNWENSQSVVHFQGHLNENWVNPFQVPFLTITSGKVKLELSSSKMDSLVKRFAIDGALSIAATKSPQLRFNTSFDMQFENNAKEYFLHLRLPETKTLVEWINYLFTIDISSTSIINDLKCDEWIDVVVMNMDNVTKFQNHFIKKGFNLLGLVRAEKNSKGEKCLKQLTPSSQEDSTSLQLPSSPQSNYYFNLNLDISRHAFQSALATIGMQGIKLDQHIKIQNIAIQFQLNAGWEKPIALTGKIQVSAKKANMTFDVNGLWNMSRSKVLLQGKYFQTWQSPFGFKWLEIENVQAYFDFYATSGLGLRLNEITFSGAPKIQFSKAAIESNVTIHWNGQDNYYAQLALNSKVQLSDVMSALNPPPPNTTTSKRRSTQIEVYGKSFKKKANAGFFLTVSSYDSKGLNGESTEIQAGINLVTNVSIVENSEVDHLVQPLFTNTLSKPITEIDLKLKVHMPPNRDQTQVKFSVPKLLINEYIVFYDLEFLVVMKQSETNIQMGGNIHWNVLNSSSELNLGVKGNWSSSSKSIVIEGNLNTPWKSPFGISWLQIDQTKLKMELKPFHQNKQEEKQQLSEQQVQEEENKQVQEEENESYYKYFSLQGECNVVLGSGATTTNQQEFKTKHSTMITENGKKFQSRFNIDGSFQSIVHEHLGKDLMKSNVDLSSLSTLKVSGNLMLAITNYENHNASEKNGIYLKSGITFISTGKVEIPPSISTLLEPLAKYENQQGSSIDYTLGFHIGLFNDENKGTGNLILHSKRIQLGNRVDLKHLRIELKLNGGGKSAELKGDLSWNIMEQYKNETTFPDIHIHGEWNSQSKIIHFIGQISNWQSPFGYDFLKIQSAQVFLNYATSSDVAFHEIKFNGNATINMKTIQVLPHVYGEITSEKKYKLELSIEGKTIESHLPEIISTVAKKDPNDFQLPVEPKGTHSALVVITNLFGTRYTSQPSSVYHDIQLCKGVNLFVGIQKGTSPNDSHQQLKLLFPHYHNNLDDLDMFLKVTIDENNVFLIDLSIKSIQLAKNIESRHIHFGLNYDGGLSFTGKGDFVVTPSIGNPIVLSGNAIWQSSKNEIKLYGGLQKVWTEPWGLHWLNITNATFEADIESNNLKHLALIASAQHATFHHVVSSEMKIEAWDNLQRLHAYGKLEMNYNFEKEFMSSVLPIKTKEELLKNSSNSLDCFSDTLFVDSSIEIDFKNFPDGEYQPGLRISGSIELKQAGQLSSKALPFIQLQKNLKFDLTFFIPLSPLSLKFFISAFEILKRDHVHFQKVSLGIELGAKTELDVDANFLVKLDGRDDWIPFDIKGKIQNIEFFELSGSTQQQINDLFNIHFLDLSNPHITIGFIFEPPFLDKISVDVTLLIGDTTVKLSGNIDLFNPSQIGFYVNIENLTLKALSDFLHGKPKRTHRPLPLPSPSTIDDNSTTRNERVLLSNNLLELHLFKFNQVELFFASGRFDTVIQGKLMHFDFGLKVKGNITICNVESTFQLSTNSKAYFNENNRIERSKKNGKTNPSIPFPAKITMKDESLFHKYNEFAPSQFDVSHDDVKRIHSTENWKTKRDALSEKWPQIVSITSGEFDLRDFILRNEFPNLYVVGKFVKEEEEIIETFAVENIVHPLKHLLVNSITKFINWFKKGKLQ